VRFHAGIDRGQGGLVDEFDDEHAASELARNVSRRKDRGFKMRSVLLSTTVLVVSSLPPTVGRFVNAAQSTTAQAIDLAERLSAGKLRAVNREVSPLKGDRRGVHVSEKEGPGVVWIEGTDFSQGTIEVDARGRDVLQQSFLGVAFHRKDDNTYESVYLRPFNFRATDPERHQHAIQYMAVPDYDWPRLRKEFSNEFERPVDASLAPTDWVALRVVVTGSNVQVFAGPVKTATLEARKLGTTGAGQVGLWVGNNSDGDFANLRIAPAK
jgi:hypothetical protein